MAKQAVFCEKNGHSFVESSLGKGAPEPAQVVYLFCQHCGEVKAIKVPE